MLCCHRMLIKVSGHPTNDTEQELIRLISVMKTLISELHDEAVSVCCCISLPFLVPPIVLYLKCINFSPFKEIFKPIFSPLDVKLLT